MTITLSASPAAKAAHAQNETASEVNAACIAVNTRSANQIINRLARQNQDERADQPLSVRECRMVLTYGDGRFMSFAFHRLMDIATEEASNALWGEIGGQLMDCETFYDMEVFGYYAEHSPMSWLANWCRNRFTTLKREGLARINKSSRVQPLAIAA